MLLVGPLRSARGPSRDEECLPWFAIGLGDKKTSCNLGKGTKTLIPSGLRGFGRFPRLHPWAGTFPWHLVPALHRDALGWGLFEATGAPGWLGRASLGHIGTYTHPSPLNTTAWIA